MNSAFSFGSYVPGESPLHKLDPRAKLLLGVAFIIVTLCANTPAALGVIAAFTLALYLIARIPLRKALRSLAPLLTIVVLVSLLNLFFVQGGETIVSLGPVRISEQGAYQCLFIGARLLLMMLATSLITLTTPTLRLTEGFERLLSPFARIGFPAHEVGMIMGIALRFMPQFAGELRTLRHAQASRGVELATSPVKGMRAVSALVIPLFTSVFRHAETLSLAMDARCYHGSDGRTRLHPLRFSARDGIATACIAALAAAVIVLS